MVLACDVISKWLRNCSEFNFIGMVKNLIYCMGLALTTFTTSPPPRSEWREVCIVLLLGPRVWQIMCLWRVFIPMAGYEGPALTVWALLTVLKNAVISTGPCTSRPVILHAEFLLDMEISNAACEVMGNAPVIVRWNWVSVMEARSCQPISWGAASIWLW